jgi:hypothetical protein
VKLSNKFIKEAKAATKYIIENYNLTDEEKRDMYSEVVLIMLLQGKHVN